MSQPNPIPTTAKQFAFEPYFAPAGKVDAEKGIIHDVVMCQVGEAKGHGMQLDQVFIDKIVELSWAAHGDSGMKCRFGHPTMCSPSLGTFIGRFYNFRVEGERALAELHLDEVARKAPQGNLYDWVLEMAEKNPSFFGASICFDILTYVDGDGNELVLDGEDDSPVGPVYPRPNAIYACDLVDDPAATDGLFSAKFNAQSFAVQVTTFLDQHPEVFSYVEKNPDVIQTFMARYKNYQLAKNPKSQQPMSTQLTAKAKAALARQKKFDIDAATTDGVNIRIVTTSDTPAVGDQVEVVNEDGTTSPAPEGTHVVNGGDLDGATIVTDANGVITEYMPFEPAQPDTPSGDAGTAALQKELAALKADVAELKKKPALPTVVGGGDNSSAHKGTDFSEKPWNKEARKLAGK